MSQWDAQSGTGTILKSFSGIVTCALTAGPGVVTMGHNAYFLSSLRDITFLGSLKLLIPNSL
jgi:hypothetical protein